MPLDEMEIRNVMWSKPHSDISCALSSNGKFPKNPYHMLISFTPFQKVSYNIIFVQSRYLICELKSCLGLTPQEFQYSKIKKGGLVGLDVFVKENFGIF